ncbi:MAG TPA: penicillin-binding protein 2 [Dehalococcoidia bacterium]|nr:penicillin-binding protein 2 [Dehalococcoidia bacterium]
MGLFKGERRRWKALVPKRERDRRAGPDPAAWALLRAIVILMFGALILQLVNLQVIKGDEYKARAEINALREVPLLPARGLIYDRNGRPLVQNSARFTATIVPGDLPERGEVAVYRMMEPILQMSVEEIEEKVQEGIDRQGAYSPAVIKQDIDRDSALILMELEPHAPGLQVMVEPSRTYSTGALLSHVLGYVGPISAEEWAELEDEGYLYQDYVGKTGVEAQYEEVLRGKLGKRLIEVDAAGRELKTIAERRPIDGANIMLSIDADLQQKVTEILQTYAANSDNAAAAVMDVHTGEILAMVSLPSYDNNIFSGKIDDAKLAELINAPGKPLVNHDLSEQYPPGSTFKTIVGSAALQEGVASPWTTITSRGYILIQNDFDPNVVYRYPDWAPLGALDFYGGLAMSSNVYFYYLAGGMPTEGFRGLGVERLSAYTKAFGFGQPTGIDIPGESSGTVPDAPWKEETVGEPWTLGDTYNFGIGQGYVAATPIQVLTAISSIANGGQLLTPHVMKALQDSHGNILSSYETRVRSQLPVEDANLQVVRAGMRRSVTDGVAKNAAVAGVDVAGKTGTAEFGPQLSNGKYETHGWFVGFAPYDNPEIAVVVFVQRGSGGNDASPAAAKILDYYFHGPRLAANVPEQRP